MKKGLIAVIVIVVVIIVVIILATGNGERTEQPIGPPAGAAGGPAAAGQDRRQLQEPQIPAEDIEAMDAARRASEEMARQAEERGAPAR